MGMPMGEGVVAAPEQLAPWDGDGPAAQKPEEPSLSARQWARQNLFSTPFNSLLTVVFGLLILVVVRGLLNFTFSEERDWDAVRTNLRLLFTHAYPEEQYIRIWVCVGVIAVLSGASLGLLARRGAGISMKKISMNLMALGGFIAAGVVLREPSVLKDSEGAARRDDGGVIRESFPEAMADRWAWWLAAVVLAGAGAAIWFGLGEAKRRHTFVPAVELFVGVLGLLVLSAWVYPWGHYAFSDGEFIAEPGRHSGHVHQAALDGYVAAAGGDPSSEAGCCGNGAWHPGSGCCSTWPGCCARSCCSGWYCAIPSWTGAASSRWTSPSRSSSLRSEASWCGCSLIPGSGSWAESLPLCCWGWRCSTGWRPTSAGTRCCRTCCRRCG